MLSLLLLSFFALASSTYAAAVGEILTQPETGWQRYDDSDPAITYSGYWSNPAGASYYNGATKLGGTAGDKATFFFYGTKIRIIAFGNTDQSKNVEITIDGNKENFTLNRPLGYQYVSYEKLGLSQGYHKVVIYNPAHTRITVDAVDIDKDGYLLSTKIVSDLIVKPGDSKVTLNWKAVNPANNFEILRATQAEGPYTTIKDNLTALDYIDAEVKNTHTYFYKVLAKENDKEIGMTDVSVVTPPFNKVEKMEGFTPPEGTTLIESDHYTDYEVARAIDGDLNTRWNASGPIANLEMTFPKPLKLNFVQMSSRATPATQVKYQIFGYKDGSWIEISQVETRDVGDGILQPINVTEGVYEKLKIAIDAQQSWVAIREITLGFVPMESDGDDTELPPDTETPPTNPPTDPGSEPNDPRPVPSGDRAILVIMLQNGVEKEYDLSMSEVTSFVNWYESKSKGNGTVTFAINKHDNNIGPFKQRNDYIVYDKILHFEVNEY